MRDTLLLYLTWSWTSVPAPQRSTRVRASILRSSPCRRSHRPGFSIEMRLSALPISLTALALAIFGPTVSAQNHTTEQGAAQITGPSLRLCPSHVDLTLTDPNEQCAPYNYPPVSDAMAAGKFPPTWALASILVNDTNALAKYQSIQSQILNISKPVPDLVAVPEVRLARFGLGPPCSHNCSQRL